MRLNGDKLITARYRKGLRQVDVVEALDSNLVTISNAENSKDIAISTAKMLCEFYELDLADMVLPVETEGNGDAA